MVGSITGLLFAAMATRFGDLRVIIAHCILSAGLVISSAIDIATHRLPREITYGTLLLSWPVLLVAPHPAGRSDAWQTSVIGAGLAAMIMSVLYVVSRGGLGDGDVRFSPLLGAFLGWHGVTKVFDGLFFGFVTGATYGVLMVIIGGAGRRTALPFGPFLALGTLLAIATPLSILDVAISG